MNQAALNAVTAAALAKAAGHPEWLRAIEKASKMLQSGELVVTLLQHDALVTSPRDSYRVNGTCPCASRRANCYHRAAVRLVEMMEETGRNATCFTADVAAPSRADVIADITRMWPATWPPLAVELMARFRRNKLEMLDDDSLRRVRLAVAA